MTITRLVSYIDFKKNKTTLKPHEDLIFMHTLTLTLFVPSGCHGHDTIAYLVCQPHCNKRYDSTTRIRIERQPASMKNIDGMLPMHMFLVYWASNISTARALLSNNFNIYCDVFNLGLSIDVMDTIVILNGSPIDTWLDTANERTGLHPFMTMARTKLSSLENMYEMNMRSLACIQSYEIKQPAVEEKKKTEKIQYKQMVMGNEEKNKALIEHM